MCVIINVLTVPVWEQLIVEFHFETNNMQLIFTEHVPAILKLPTSYLPHIYQPIYVLIEGRFSKVS